MATPATPPYEQFSQNGLYFHRSSASLYYVKFFNGGVQYWGLDSSRLDGSCKGFVSDFKRIMTSRNYERKTVDSLTEEQRAFLFEKLLNFIS
jgi:hypothetical protein